MLRAKETIHVATKDGMRTISPEDRFEDGDDLVKGRTDLFEQAPEADELKPVRTRRTSASKAKS